MDDAGTGATGAPGTNGTNGTNGGGVILTGGAKGNITAGFFQGLGNLNNASATETESEFVVPRSGTLRNFYVYLQVGTVLASTETFTVRVGNMGGALTDTTIKCTSPTTAATTTTISCSDTTHSASITAGQTLTVSASVTTGKQIWFEIQLD